MSKLRLDFSSAPWAAVGAARTRAAQLFEAVTGNERSRARGQASAEHLSLGELLYRAIVERTEIAS